MDEKNKKYGICEGMLPTHFTFCPLCSVTTDIFMVCLLFTFVENPNPEMLTSGRWQFKIRLDECIATNGLKSDLSMTHSFCILQSDIKQKLQGWLRGQFYMQPNQQDALIFTRFLQGRKKVPVTKRSLTYSIFKMKKKYN